MRFFDVHTHTQFAAFKDDWRAVINRALGSDIWLIQVGTQKDTSKRAVEIAREYDEGVWATVGLHPIHTEKSYHDPQELAGGTGFESRGEEFDYEYYKNLAADPHVVAIGECGLDYYRLRPDTKQKQKIVFEKQIELAAEAEKPLMIHCRSAFEDLIEILQARSRRLPAVPGIVHFFSGTVEDAKNLLDLGFSFSFGGVVTFAPDYDEVVRYIALERILLETDAPYVAPMPYRGKRNEPMYVIEVAKKIAELKNLSLEEVSSQTTRTAETIFKLGDSTPAP